MTLDNLSLEQLAKDDIQENSRLKYTAELEKVVSDYLGIVAEDYEGDIPNIIVQTARDLEGLRVKSELFEDPTLVTIILGIEEIYLDEVNAIPKLFRRKSEINNRTRAATRSKNARLIEVLTFDRENSYGARIESFTSKGGFIDLLPTENSDPSIIKTNYPDDMNTKLKIMEEEKDEEASRIFLEYIRNNKEIFRYPIENFNLTETEFQHILDRFSVIITKLTHEEFVERTRGVQAFVFTKFYGFDKTKVISQTMVLPSIEYPLNEFMLKMIRHEFTHLLGSISKKKRGYLGSVIDRGLNEAITEVGANLPNARNIRVRSLKNIELNYYHTQHPEIFLLMSMLNGLSLYDFKLSDIFDIYRGDHAQMKMFDSAIVQAFKLSARAKIALIEIGRQKPDSSATTYSTKEIVDKWKSNYSHLLRSQKSRVYRFRYG